MKDFFRLADVDNEKDFYEKYPTKEDFYNDFLPLADDSYNDIDKDFTEEQVFRYGGQLEEVKRISEDMGEHPRDVLEILAKGGKINDRTDRKIIEETRRAKEELGVDFSKEKDKNRAKAIYMAKYLNSEGLGSYDISNLSNADIKNVMSKANTLLTKNLIDVDNPDTIPSLFSGILRYIVGKKLYNINNLDSDILIKDTNRRNAIIMGKYMSDLTGNDYGTYNDNQIQKLQKDLVNYYKKNGIDYTNDKHEYNIQTLVNAFDRSQVKRMNDLIGSNNNIARQQAQLWVNNHKANPNYFTPYYDIDVNEKEYGGKITFSEGGVMNGLPQYAGGKSAQEEGEPPEDNDNIYNNYNDYLSWQKEYAKRPIYASGDTEASAQNLKNQISSSGFETINGTPISNLDFSTPTSQDEIATSYRHDFKKEYPIAYNAYGKRAAGGVRFFNQYLKNGYGTREELNKILKSVNPNFHIPKKAGKVLGVGRKNITAEELKAVNDKIWATIPKEDWSKMSDAVVDDGLYYYRNPIIKRVHFDSQEAADKALGKDNRLKQGDKLGKAYSTDLKDVFIVPVIDEKKPKKEEEIEGTPIVDNLEYTKAGWDYPRRFFTPGSGLIPPKGLQSEGLYTTSFSRLDPLRVGIEPQLKAINESVSRVRDMSKSLPASQRAALIASTMASAQQAESDAITKATMANAQSRSKVNQYNAAQADKERMYNQRARQNFETRMLKGMDNTEHDVRDYYAALQNYWLRDLNRQMKLNTLDRMAPDISIDPFGIAGYYNPDQPLQLVNVNGNKYYMLPAQARGISVAQTKEDED